MYDYWEMMRKHPRCAGGFLWVLADEGVKRVDMNGFIDNCGNYGADGIVGPHHEKREVILPSSRCGVLFKSGYNCQRDQLFEPGSQLC